jgi:hypothetical protein
VPPRLFDDFERTDPRYAKHAESAFEFLNRVATSWWSTLRRELEAWFADYCQSASVEKAADLRARFRSRDARQHAGAWWELYVFRLLRCLYPGRRVGIELERAGQAARPDFSVLSAESGAVEVWVEAVSTFTGIVGSGRHSGREAVVLDVVNEVVSRDFWVSISFRAVGLQQLAKREIVVPLREWLNRLDREDVLALYGRSGELPTMDIAARGWRIHFRAVPKGTPGTTPNSRLIGIGPSVASYVDDAAATRRAILAKSSRYRELDAPFVVALLPASPVLSEEDVQSALFGSPAIQFEPEHPEGGEIIRQRDGVWSRGRGGRVSALLVGTGLAAWTVAKTWPHLWPNPWADFPISVPFSRLPWTEVQNDGAPNRHDPEARTPAELLGLPSEWPGEGDPFRQVT